MIGYINYDFFFFFVLLGTLTMTLMIIKLDNQFVYFVLLLQEMLEDTFGPVTISHKVCSQSDFTFRRLFVCLFGYFGHGNQLILYMNIRS